MEFKPVFFKLAVEIQELLTYQIPHEIAPRIIKKLIVEEIGFDFGKTFNSFLATSQLEMNKKS